MVGTILPAVRRSSSQILRLSIISAYVVGSIVGGATVGGIVSKVGLLLQFHAIPLSVRSITLFVVTCLLGLDSLGVINIDLPQSKRQVPVIWKLLPSPLMALLYGYGLGVGFGTFMPVSTLYVPVSYSLLLENVTAGAAVMGAFGLGRAIPILWFLTRGYRVKTCLSKVDMLVRNHARIMFWNGIGLMFVAGVLCPFGRIE